jgi:hypothetical protein
MWPELPAPASKSNGCAAGAGSSGHTLALPLTRFPKNEKTDLEFNCEVCHNAKIGEGRKL